MPEYRSEGWSQGWGDADKCFSYQNHLASSEAEIKNPQLLAHLESSTIMIKSLHSEQTKSKAAADSLKLAFDELKLKQNLDMQKVLNPIVERQDKIEKKQEALLHS